MKYLMILLLLGGCGSTGLYKKGECLTHIKNASWKYNVFEVRNTINVDGDVFYVLRDLTIEGAFGLGSVHAEIQAISYADKFHPSKGIPMNKSMSWGIKCPSRDEEKSRVFKARND